MIQTARNCTIFIPMRQFILFLSTSSALKLHFPISNFQTIIGKNNQMDVAEDILRIHPDFICIQRVICSEQRIQFIFVTCKISFIFKPRWYNHSKKLLCLDPLKHDQSQIIVHTYLASCILRFSSKRESLASECKRLVSFG